MIKAGALLKMVYDVTLITQEYLSKCLSPTVSHC